MIMDPKTLATKVRRVLNNRSIYKSMLMIPKENILDRSYRQVILMSALDAYCKMYGCDPESKEAKQVLEYLYLELMNSIHLLFAEPIIQILAGKADINTKSGRVLHNHLIEFGFEDEDEEVKDNVYNLDDYRMTKEIN